MDKELNDKPGDKPPVKVAAIFDLDRTITRNDTFIPFLLIALKGRPYRIFHALILPFSVLLYVLGLRDNGWLKRVFLEAIAGGASRAQIKTWSARLIGNLQSRGFNVQALEQLDHHRQCGHLTVLISASFDFYVRPLGDDLEMDTVICTEAVWTEASRLSGSANTENCYGPVKLRRIRDCFPGDRNHWRTVVYSDHCSDLPLLKWADQAVVVNPGRKAEKMAQSRKFEVRYWQ